MNIHMLQLHILSMSCLLLFSALDAIINIQIPKLAIVPVTNDTKRGIKRLNSEY
ncbi:hypothetical protein [Candidatus Liberibacter americanus]|uniref:Uncharacterized protein n=1 Tax=Candidatus Liberibacter americanus str. Sao Paulo TaxID=1261131 RepID=U6B5D1_9HYPH|nr:hypothetical protein [Candidatus Liberibacter americanus]AHA27848.1 hypothetical protein lam_489 [Candidatus Liberibacter americanus str. Sao Paulo]